MYHSQAHEEAAWIEWSFLKPSVLSHCYIWPLPKTCYSSQLLFYQNHLPIEWNLCQSFRI